jgi:hypothetical protein
VGTCTRNVLNINGNQTQRGLKIEYLTTSVNFLLFSNKSSKILIVEPTPVKMAKNGDCHQKVGPWYISTFSFGYDAVILTDQCFYQYAQETFCFIVYKKEKCNADKFIMKVNCTKYPIHTCTSTQ